MFHESMKTHELRDIKSGKPYAVGDKAKTFRDEEVTINGWIAGDHPGSTGRVLVTHEHKGRASVERSYFPSVISAMITEIKP